MCKMIERYIGENMLYNYDFNGKYAADEIKVNPRRKRDEHDEQDDFTLKDRSGRKTHNRNIDVSRNRAKRVEPMTMAFRPTHNGKGIVHTGENHQSFDWKRYDHGVTRRENKAECVIMIKPEYIKIGGVTVDDTTPDFWEDLVPVDYYRKDVNGETIYTSFDADCAPKSLLWDDKVGRQLIVCEIAIAEQERIRRDKLWAERNTIQAEIHRLRQRLSEVNAEISAMDAE